MTTPAANMIAAAHNLLRAMDRTYSGACAPGSEPGPTEAESLDMAHVAASVAAAALRFCVDAGLDATTESIEQMLVDLERFQEMLDSERA
jgi:hypothetical protein